MYDFLSSPPTNLRWLQSTPTTFELRAGDFHFGDLRFDAWQNRRAIGTVADGRWYFELAGFLRRRIEVFEADTMHNVGVMARTGAKAGILFAPGTGTRISDLVWSQRQRAWSSADDWLIRFRPGGESLADLFKFQYDVELDQSVRGLKELSLLLLVGWYALASAGRRRR